MVASTTEVNKKKATTVSKTGAKSTPAAKSPAQKPKAAAKTTATSNDAVAVATKASSTPAETNSAKSVSKPAAATAKVKQAAASQASVPALPDQEIIDKMIAEAAYYLAEQRDFAPGFEEQDWQTAREQVMAQLQAAPK